MDETDRDIVAILQSQGRISNQELAERVHLSPSPCLRRMRLLEESHVVTGYTAIVDEELYGLPVTAFVGIRLKVHSAESAATFERAVQAVDEVMDCYVMTGRVDYLLRVLVQSLKHYERFVRTQLHAIPGIESIDTSFAYGRVKRASVFPRVRDRGV